MRKINIEKYNNVNAWWLNDWISIGQFFLLAICAITASIALIFLSIFIYKKLVQWNRVRRSYFSRYYAFDNTSASKKQRKKDRNDIKKRISKSTKDVLSIQVSFGLFKWTTGKNLVSSNFAWVVIVELLTRVLVNKIKNQGDSKIALKSIYNFFILTREELKKNKVDYMTFDITLKLLNKKIRPFTTKWHGKINDKSDKIFRKELLYFQKAILESNEIFLLAEIANINVPKISDIIEI